MAISGKQRWVCAWATLICAGSAFSGSALAGGFAVREQSTSGLGSSFAGIAAGNDLSSMYWNPAATANIGGFNSEDHATVALPDTSITANGGSALGFPYNLSRESGDLSGPMLIGASYYNYQATDQLFFGLAVNSPFGFTTKPENGSWAGESFARTSKIFSLNFNPTVAYKVSPQLTFGAGLQVQYIDVTLSQAAYPGGGGILASAPTVRLEGDDIGFGATAGVTWQPVEGTKIGAGYRSAIGVNLDGNMKGGAIPPNVPGVNPGNSAIPFSTVDIATNFYLPEMVTLSLRQDLTRNLTLLGTAEWSNWSRFGSVEVISQGTGGYGNQFGPNSTAKTLHLNWDDGWFFSGGLEIKYNPAWTFRTGVAWERSPISDSNRMTLLPDSDRLWVSGGLTHKFSEKYTVDFAYSHIFFEDGAINQSSEDKKVTLQATSHTDIDLISASLKVHMGAGLPLIDEPLK